jgi:hypothetical protein
VLRVYVGMRVSLCGCGWFDALAWVGYLCRGSIEVREIPDHILEKDDIAGALGEDLNKVYTPLSSLSLLRSGDPPFVLEKFPLRVLPHPFFQRFLPPC